MNICLHTALPAGGRKLKRRGILSVCCKNKTIKQQYIKKRSVCNVSD